MKVQNLTANLNRSELNYTTVMRELCEAQSTLLTFTGRQANAIGDESSGSIESNIQKTEMLTRTIDCDVLQQDASTECSHSVSAVNWFNILIVLFLIVKLWLYLGCIRALI